MIKLTGVLAVTACILVFLGCDDTPPPESCVDIPDEGCPEDEDADVCEDVTCSAVYACNGGVWSLAYACPSRPDAGLDGGRASDAATLEASVTSLRDVEAVDAPPGAFGGADCIDLEQPDCSVGTALLCSGAVDCCGCQDLYVCQGGGWIPWGECTDAGVVQQP